MHRYTIMVASAENADGHLPEISSFYCGPSFDDCAAYTVMPYEFATTATSIWQAVEFAREDLSLQPGDLLVVDGSCVFQVLPNTVADLNAERTIEGLEIAMLRTPR